MKLNIGSGRRLMGEDGEYKNIDIMPFTDANGKQLVDYVLNVEKEKLPFEDNSIDEIQADSVLEHLYELIFPMNEFHRVLKVGGLLKGTVPVAGSVKSFQDPTHRRFFLKETFAYFTGTGIARPDRPYHPRYADYGILPWNEVMLKQEDQDIFFELSPRK